MADLKFSVKAHSENPTKTVVKARGFEMIIDEPANFGGTDEGATPVEYLLATLSGCLSVVAHIVAREMNFELRGVKIDLEGSLNPEKLFGKETKDRVGYKNIDVKIEADTDADKETLEKWLVEVEARCPISDNISNPTPISISLK